MRSPQDPGELNPRLRVDEVVTRLPAQALHSLLDSDIIESIHAQCLPFDRRKLPGKVAELASWGGWYVVAHIPMAAEVYEAVESYALADDGTIDVRFRFCDGAVDGPLEVITMRGWVYDPVTNAEWRVRPVWPLRFRYQIAELDPEYTTTVVVSGKNAWVMARRPQMDEAQLAAITGRLAERGFETDALRRIPHQDVLCSANS
jgi:apolipoprotein D and lipocalin family protein